MKKSAAWFAAGLLVVGWVWVAVFTSYSLAQSQENGQVSATYVHGVLDVVVPYSAPRNGAGDLMVEVVDPEDRVVAGVNTPVYVRAGRGLPQEAIAIRDGLPVDDHCAGPALTEAAAELCAVQGKVNSQHVQQRR